MDDWKTLAKEGVQEREWRESVKRFQGDPKLSAQYLPIARTILGGLAQQLRLGGIEYGHRIVNLPDGTWIRVIRNGNQNTVEILTTSVTYTPISTPSSSAGFVFYPRIKKSASGIPGVSSGYTPSYPKQKPHALMVVTCKENMAETTITAPALKEYGNQFVFFEKDVYSWTHSDRGDLGIQSGGKSIVYKNGVTWWTFYHGVIGFCPVEVEITLDSGIKVKQMRYLVATSGTRVWESRLKCYIEESGALVELGAETPLFTENLSYSNVFWPCRFKSDGSEAALLYSFSETLTVPTGIIDNGFPIPGYPATVGQEVYRIIHCTIQHQEQGITAQVSQSTEGTVKYWKEGQQITQSTETSKGIPENWYGTPPSVAGTSVDWKVSASGTFSSSSSVSTALEGGAELNLRYPVALNYKKQGATERLVVAYALETFGSLRQETRTSESSARREIELKMTRATIGDPWTVLKHRESFDGEGLVVRNATWSTSRGFSVSVDSETLVSAYADGASSYTERSVSSSHSVGNVRGSLYYNPVLTPPELDNRVEYTQSSTDKTVGFSGGVLYLNIRHNVTVSSSAVLNTVKKITTTASAVTGLTGTQYSGSSTTQETKDFSMEFRFNNGTSPTKTLTHFQDLGGSTKTVASGVPNTGVGFIDDKSYSRGLSRINYGVFSYYSTGVGASSTVQISYVNDERIDCGKEAWAYSIDYLAAYGGKPVITFLESVCTYGPIGPYLPVVNAKGEPTDAKLTDPNLTVFPIGLY